MHKSNNAQVEANDEKECEGDTKIEPEVDGIE